MGERDRSPRSARPKAAGRRDDAEVDGASRAAELEEINARLAASLEDDAPREQSLAISEAQYRAGFEFSNVGQVHFHPTTGTIFRANRAYASMLGYEPEELVGLVLRDLSYVEDRSTQRYGQLLRGNIAAYSAEQRYVRRDGSLVWGRFSVSMARAPGGRAFLALAFFEDIDERYKAQLALQRAKHELEAVVEQRTRALEEKTRAEQSLVLSEAQFRAGFELSVVGQVQFEPVPGTIIRANRAFANMLGYEPEEIVGRPLQEFIHPDDHDRPEFRLLLSGALECYAVERRYMRRDGSAIWVRASCSLARAKQGERAFLALAIIEDVDDRYRAQVALEAAKQDLEAVVEERTETLAQRDLLLREVYHRVKNNLQIIDSLMVMQAQSLSDPAARAGLDDMRRRVYALGLVHHQLMGSDDLQTFDVAPFLQELSRHLVDGVGARGVSISMHATPLRVGLDFAIPLGLLVTELVTNSMKHAFDGDPGSIHVALEKAEGNQVVLQVSDDGEGYDPATSGSTLGMFIIQGLVRQLKGTVAVHAGRGTHTVVRLPAPVQG